MATRTPNLNKLRSAWTRWQSVWSDTVPLARSVVSNNQAVLRGIRRK